MQRRNFMKTVGGIGTAGALGIGATVLASSPVSASSNINGTVSLSSDDGTIEHVSIYGDGRFEWKGLDTRATQARIKVFVTVEDLDGNVLADRAIHNTGAFDLSNSNWGGDDEELSGPGTRGYIESAIGLSSNGTHDPNTDWAIIQASGYSDPYGLPSNPIDAAKLANGDDGTEITFNVTVESQYLIYDSNGTQLQSATAGSTFQVDGENIESQSDTSDGLGNDGATGGAENDGTL